MTLEELARKYCFDNHYPNEFKFELDDLRALIEESVGIVQGEPVGLDTSCKENIDELGWPKLHHNDLGRLQ